MDRFFPEGREQWEATPEYQRRRQEAIAAVNARYAPLLAGAGPVRRLWLQWQRRRAIERELETLSPTDACFLMAPSADPSTMATALDFHGWRFLANPEATAAAYAAGGTSSARSSRPARKFIPLEPNAGALGKDWTVFFLPGETSLKLATLPSAPLVQVEFTASLPWVLEEPYPDPGNE